MNKEDLYVIQNGDTGQQMAEGLKSNFDKIVDSINEGGDGSITVDSELLDTSVNSVQNKVITGKLSELNQKGY